MTRGRFPSRRLKRGNDRPEGYLRIGGKKIKLEAPWTRETRRVPPMSTVPWKNINQYLLLFQSRGTVARKTMRFEKAWKFQLISFWFQR